MDVSLKILRRKTLAEEVFDRRWSCDGAKTLIREVSLRDLQLCWSLQWGWALCGWPKPEH